MSTFSQFRRTVGRPAGRRISIPNTDLLGRHTTRRARGLRLGLWSSLNRGSETSRELHENLEGAASRRDSSRFDCTTNTDRVWWVIGLESGAVVGVSKIRVAQQRRGGCRQPS